MYQRVGSAAYKADLSNTIKLSAHLNEPQKSFKSIHVAGTNGKGSSSHMLASVFQEAGYKTGLYTSPHLKDFRERIKINGELIPKRNVSNFVKKNKTFFEANQLSFFEMTVGLAFDYFRKEKVDIAIIETGLGGRLDSTNIILPEISVITNIGLEHTQFLGNSLAEIAGEKAGIIKHKTPVVIGETLSETKPVFLRIAQNNKAPIFFAEDENPPNYDSDLKGNYQQKNLNTVFQTLKVLKNRGWKISEKAIKKGLKNTIKNTGLRGRWQILKQTPKVIVDTAHNADGLRETMKQLLEEKYENLHFVLGFVTDKDLSSVFPLFPKNAQYYFCKPDLPRGLDVIILNEKAIAFGLSGNIFGSVKKAYKAALKKASPDDVIYIGGSTFVVAEVL